MTARTPRTDLIVLALLAVGFAAADWQCRRGVPFCPACNAPPALIAERAARSVETDGETPSPETLRQNRPAEQ